MKPTDYKGKTIPFYEKTDSEDFKFGEGIYHVCATGSYYCYYDGERLVDRWKVMHGEQPYWQSDEEPTAFCYTPFEDWAKPIKIADEYVDKFLKLIEKDKENK